MAQDKFFLEAFSQAYTLALAKLPLQDTRGIRQFAGLVKGVQVRRLTWPVAAHCVSLEPDLR